MTTKNPHAVALGRRGGSVTSAAKTAAARKNAQKGGRPRKKPKVCAECCVYPADKPSPLCAGCDAYRDHTAI